jgi:hypothetical protein
MSMDADKIYNEVLAAGEDWADKKAAYEALDDCTKSVLADITSNFMDGKTSKTESEMRALASGDFKTHLASVKVARRAWLMSQVKYDSIKMLAELRRSQESSRRAEMSLR